MRIMITGGAGFIGSALIRHLLEKEKYDIMNIDCLTYAGNLDSLNEAAENSRYSFKKIDICDQNEVKTVINEFEPNKIMHLAAESHVDRSIDGPKEFIRTNIFGTFNLLNISLDYYQKLDKKRKENFIFHHISTDEVFGDLVDTTSFFTEESPYDPSSPYSASKASSDHLVRAWNRTFNLPTIITNCSNNYGPFQFPEKLIPLVIIKALNGESIPLYGDGLQIRDWLYVQDHVKALEKVILDGNVGETYNIGGNNEKTNLEVVSLICDTLEVLAPNKPSHVKLYKDLINFVEDRPGHDSRYAIDASKITHDLGWVPDETFTSGLKKTIKWFLDNKDWWEKLT